MASKPSLRAIYDVRAEARYGPYIYFDELPESSDGTEGIWKRSEGIVGSSQTPSRMLDQVRAAAPADSKVVIEGKMGTGKTIIANAIDTHSVRRVRPFISPGVWKLVRFEVDRLRSTDTHRVKARVASVTNQDLAELSLPINNFENGPFLPPNVLRSLPRRLGKIRVPIASFANSRSPHALSWTGNDGLDMKAKNGAITLLAGVIQWPPSE